MKKTAIAMLLVAAPLAAQDFEVGVFLGQQSFKDVTIAGNEAKPASKTVAGMRFGYSVVDLGPALFQLTAGYQPKFKTDVEVNGANSGNTFTHEHLSVGAMFNFKAYVAVGAGVEYRFEKLGGEAPGDPTVSTTYGRPWARANVGFAFPTPLVKPFVGLEVAVPLVSKSLSDSEYLASALGDGKDALKTHAPKLQIGLYAGLRF